MEEQIKHVQVISEEPDTVDALAIRIINGVPFNTAPPSKHIVEVAKFSTMLVEVPPDHIHSICALVQVSDDDRAQSEFRAAYIGHPQQMMGMALLTLSHVARGSGIVKPASDKGLTPEEIGTFIAELFRMEKQAREEQNAAGSEIIATDNPVH